MHARASAFCRNHGVQKAVKMSTKSFSTHKYDFLEHPTCIPCWPACTGVSLISIFMVDVRTSLMLSARDWYGNSIKMQNASFIF